MRKLLLTGTLLALAIAAHGQVSNPSVRYVSSAPSGACSQAPPVQVLNSSGAIYTCNNGTWGQAPPAGAPPANWYVDQSIGNDSYPGTSPGAPFATIRRALADNQLLYSQQFDVAGIWSVLGGAGTITPNIAVGDGTVASFVPNTANSSHLVVQQYGTLGVASVCIGPDGYTAAVLQTGNSGIGFNLSAGTTFAITGISASPFYGMIPASTGTCGPQLISAANWYRVWVAAAGSNQGFYIGALNGTTGSTSFAGDGTSGIYLWGAEGNTTDDYIVDGPSYYLQTSGFPATTLQSNQTLAISGGNGAGSPLIYREGVYPDLSLTNLTITGYGANRPVIAADDTILASAWSADTGTTYKATISPQFGVGGAGNAWINFFENGILIYPMATSQVNCEATPGSYFIANNGVSLTSPSTLYYNPSAADNPGTNGKLYEFSARDYALNYGQAANAPITLSHLTTRRQTAANGSIGVGEYVTANDVWALDGTKHNWFVGQNSVLTDSGTVGAYFNDIGTALLIAYETTVSGGSLTLNNFTCSNYLHPGVTVFNAQVGCVYAHQGTGSWGPLIINGISISNMSAGVDGEFSTMTVNNEHCVNSAQCVNLFNDPTTINNSYLATANTPTVQVSGSSAAILTIKNSTIIGGGENTGTIYANTAPVNLTLTGSTISKTTTGGYLVKLDAAGSSFTASKNIFDTTLVDSNSRLVYELASGYLTYNSDYNQFLRMTSLSYQPFTVNGSFYTLPQVQSNFSQELHSTYP